MYGLTRRGSKMELLPVLIAILEDTLPEVVEDLVIEAAENLQVLIVDWVKNKGPVKVTVPKEGLQPIITIEE